MKKFVILGGAILGGTLGWYTAAPNGDNGEIFAGIITGIMVGTFLASWVWSFVDDGD